MFYSVNEDCFPIVESISVWLEAHRILKGTFLYNLIKDDHISWYKKASQNEKSE